MTAAPPSVTDEEIVARIVRGDSSAYATLMERYEAKLTRYVIYLIHNNGIAADVVQDTFIKAYHNLRGFKPSYQFSSWIYRIAHNEAMNAVKKYYHYVDADITVAADESYDTNTGDLIDMEALKEDVLDCLQNIKPKYRDVVQLIYFEHMKYEQVSDVLRIPVSTVGVRLSRAKQQLKMECQKKGVVRS